MLAIKGRCFTFLWKHSAFICMSLKSIEVRLTERLQILFLYPPTYIILNNTRQHVYHRSG